MERGVELERAVQMVFENMEVAPLYGSGAGRGDSPRRSASTLEETFPMCGEQLQRRVHAMVFSIATKSRSSLNPDGLVSQPTLYEFTETREGVESAVESEDRSDLVFEER